jgi:predicted metal-dependent peptidase
MSKNVVQKSIYRLLEKEPFYAHFILNSNILYDKYNVPTAGVCVIQGVPTFVFNTKFVSTLDEAQCMTILKHEVLHLVMDHLGQAKGFSKEDQYLANIATDCAINQYLDHLPEGCVTLDGLSKAVGYPLAPFQTSDYYFDHIKKKQEEVQKSGAKTLDEHDIAGEEDKGSAQVNKAAVEAIAKKAVNQAAGNAPRAVVEQLALSGQAVFPWKQILRNFIMKQIANTTLNTQKKVNRRFAMPVPGKKKKRTMTLGVCADSSGSVSNDQYAMFLQEVKSIAKQVDITWFIQADCEVQKVEKLTNKTTFVPNRAGMGGTAYQPAITKAKELGCDVIIYFGDFDSADVPVDPKVPFLWVGVGKQEPPGAFGKVLRLPG